MHCYAQLSLFTPRHLTEYWAAKAASERATGLQVTRTHLTTEGDLVISLLCPERCEGQQRRCVMVFGTQLARAAFWLRVLAESFW